MADAQRPPDEPDALAAADEVLDPADLALVSRALEAVRFLRPSEDEPDADPVDDAPPHHAEPMPPWVWDRVSAALAAQAPAGRQRSPRWLRWGGGLVAASVAVLAIGVAVTAFSGGGDEPVMVAGDTAPKAGANLEAPSTLSFAGIVPPALRLVDTQTDYTATQLGDQVTDVLTDLGMEPEAARSAMQQAPVTVAVPEPVDLLQSARSLRDCVTKLTKLATSTALLVDWATFEGREAGVVVTPEYASTDTGTMSLPDTSELDIWVIDDDCDVQARMHIRMR